MFSSKNNRQEIMLQLRAGYQLVVLIAVIVMLFTSMATSPSAAFWLYACSYRNLKH